MLRFTFERVYTKLNEISLAVGFPVSGQIEWKENEGLRVHNVAERMWQQTQPVGLCFDFGDAVVVSDAKTSEISTVGGAILRARRTQNTSYYFSLDQAPLDLYLTQGRPSVQNLSGDIRQKDGFSQSYQGPLTSSMHLIRLQRGSLRDAMIQGFRNAARAEQTPDGERKIRILVTSIPQDGRVQAQYLEEAGGRRVHMCGIDGGIRARTVNFGSYTV